MAALDIGGTKIAGALVDDDGHVRARGTTPTPGPDGADAILAAAARLVADLGGSPAALGVGSAGVIDSRTGTVLSSTAVLAGWAGTAVRSELAARTGIDCVVVDNDVNAHAIGEAWRGAAVGAASSLFVGVGTGVGASWVTANQVWHGARSTAGHLGHAPVSEADGLRCVCGGVGHLEAIAAGPAIAAHYARRTGTTAIGLPQVAELAGTGDDDAREVIVTGARALGRVVGGLVNMLDPEVVVVGGGVTALGERWWEPVVTAVRGELLPPVRDLPIRLSAVGGDAALLGAARLAQGLAHG